MTCRLRRRDNGGSRRTGDAEGLARVRRCQAGWLLFRSSTGEHEEHPRVTASYYFFFLASCGLCTSFVLLVASSVRSTALLVVLLLCFLQLATAGHAGAAVERIRRSCHSLPLVT